MRWRGCWDERSVVGIDPPSPLNKGGPELEGYREDGGEMIIYWPDVEELVEWIIQDDTLNF